MKSNYVLDPLMIRLKNICLLLLFSPFFAFSQQAFISSGANITDGGGKADYSIGQIFYATLSSDNGSLSQGIQFYFEDEILSITEIDSNWNTAVYPNPTTSVLNLESESDFSGSLTYEIYDVTGRSILSGKVLGKKTRIDFSPYRAAVYILNVRDAKTSLVKTYRIIKE